jgi:Flp pilus assembly protein TadG
MGFLLIPAGLLVVSFPRWSERQNMASVAAAEASRAVAVASDTDAGIANARNLVAEIAANHGVDPATVSVSFTGSTTRGGTVTATVAVDLPALSVPPVGSVGSVRWSTSHSEAVDQYRGFAP